MTYNNMGCRLKEIVCYSREDIKCSESDHGMAFIINIKKKKNNVFLFLFFKNSYIQNLDYEYWDPMEMYQ